MTGAPVLSEPSQLSFLRLDQRALRLQLSGNWTLRGRLPSAEEVRNHLDSAPGTQRILFDTTALTGWDSGLLVFLINVRDLCAANHLTMDREGLPPGVRKLLDLAAAVPEKKGARREPTREPVLRTDAAREHLKFQVISTPTRRRSIARRRRSGSAASDASCVASNFLPPGPCARRG